MQVKVNQSFNRLDKFLFQYFESIPLSLIQRLIRQYKIKINNKKSKANSYLNFLITKKHAKNSLLKFLFNKKTEMVVTQELLKRVIALVILLTLASSSS